MQGVGLYNNLLSGENSSKNNNEEDETEKFNESNLYSVNSLGYYEIVERASDVENGTAEKVTVKNNRVYCCGKPTIYDYYGKIVVQPYVFSTTSEFANVAFILRGPFYAENTTVTITYDTNEVYAKLYPESLEYDNDIQLVTEDGAMVTDDSQMENIPSGYKFKISSTKNFIPVRLRIKRSNFTVNNGVVPELITSITLNNGVEDTVVKIHFCETILFYKDGIGYNGFDPNNMSTTDPNAATATHVNQKYIYFYGGDHLRYLWIYNSADRVGNNKLYIDCGKNIKLYFRVLNRHFLQSNNQQFKCFDLTYRSGGDYKDGHWLASFSTANCYNYLRRWPSYDGFIASRFCSYACCFPQNAVIEQDLAIGIVGSLKIAEFGIIKYNNIDINGWGS